MSDLSRGEFEFRARGVFGCKRLAEPLDGQFSPLHPGEGPSVARPLDDVQYGPDGKAVPLLEAAEYGKGRRHDDPPEVEDDRLGLLVQPGRPASASPLGLAGLGSTGGGRSSRAGSSSAC